VQKPAAGHRTGGIDMSKDIKRQQQAINNDQTLIRKAGK
jgi:hypothetical protein